ncbi:DUF7096 domain-containing protein [Halogranum rubrum]|uniref:DUF7096 domain-containing protein n=1 Tax=Halogranum salarium B-1 TaxID=1210908 RepID=J3JFJ6_9EURY|nr:hypothetical protein [Halogranum salarium]EJN59281.1 hypothetical protein HSB1_27020 [Halogranum salarium B-1]
MRVVAVVSLLLVCSVLTPSAVLAEPVTPLGTSALGPVDVDLGNESVAAVQSSENDSGESDQSSQSNQSSGSFGLQVSSFVQSTTAETNGVVENEMWEANVNRSGRPTEVTRRVDRLDRRVTSLRDRRQSLTNEYENGTLSTLRYRAQLAQLNGELNALSAAASSTERAATRLNANPRGLSEVRSEIQRSRAETPPLGRPNNARSNSSNATRGGPNDRWERNASNRSSERPVPEERGSADQAGRRNRSGGGPPSDETGAQGQRNRERNADDVNETRGSENANDAANPGNANDANDTRGQGNERRPDNARESSDGSSGSTSNSASNADTDASASTNDSEAERSERDQNAGNAADEEKAKNPENAGGSDTSANAGDAGNAANAGNSSNSEER